MLLTVLLCVPVLLLPLTTSVPTWIVILLAIVDVALIWLQGGHGLGGDNIDQFVDVMINKVLAETYPADD